MDQATTLRALMGERASLPEESAPLPGVVVWGRPQDSASVAVLIAASSWLKGEASAIVPLTQARSNLEVYPVRDQLWWADGAEICRAETLEQLMPGVRRVVFIAPQSEPSGVFSAVYERSEHVIAVSPAAIAQGLAPVASEIAERHRVDGISVIITGLSEAQQGEEVFASWRRKQPDHLRLIYCGTHSAGDAQCENFADSTGFRERALEPKTLLDLRAGGGVILTRRIQEESTRKTTTPWMALLGEGKKWV